MISVLLAALNLIPWPKSVVENSGLCPTNAAVRYETDAALPSEAYRLAVTTGGVTVVSGDAAGRFYAERTLKQLLTPSGYACAEIVDAPAYRWRGFMLDEGRYFFGKDVVKRELELLADFKFNVFHWHLTEDQGWRLAVEGMPELVEYGAVRPQSVAWGYNGIPKVSDGGGPDQCVLDGVKYGPFFYTAADVAEVLEHARKLHIAVVPEIEFPGHVRALLAAHPEFSCVGDLERTPRMLNGVEREVLCLGNDEAVTFAEQVVLKVAAMFPGEWFHIGGDEAPRSRWKECPKCRAKIAALGLRDERELQGWFTRRLTAALAKAGKRAIGWDEVYHADCGRETVVQCWRKGEYVAEVANAGYDVIASPWLKTYYSRPQGLLEDSYYYLSVHGINLEEAYAYDPVEGVPDAVKGKVVGGECCVWSERTFNRFDLEWKLWPRAMAFAECVWTAPRQRDFADFSRRAFILRSALINNHVNSAPLK